MSARASKKQQELLEFINGFVQGQGYGPSYREIMRALGYKSVSTVAAHVDQLIVKGYLEKKDNSARSLVVVGLRQPGVDAASAGQRELRAAIERLKKAEKFDEVETLTNALKILQSNDS